MAVGHSSTVSNRDVHGHGHEFPNVFHTLSVTVKLSF